MKRTAILLFSAFFITFSFFSLEFLLTHINHSHEYTGQENFCSVCIIIHSVNNLIKQFFASAKTCLPVITILLGAHCILKNNLIPSEYYSLVTLKVRIDN